MQGITLTSKPSTEPAYRRRPDPDASGFAMYEPEPDRPTVFVCQSVIEKIADHSRDKGPDEAIGFLSGRVFRDDGGPWVVVSEAWCCQHARASRTTVETTDRDERLLEVWRHGEGIALDRLGWWHSHYELRFHQYSGVDRDNQGLWCPKPWQVGLLVLVDDGAVRVRCYQGPRSEALSPMRRLDGPAEAIPREGRHREEEASPNEPAALRALPMRRPTLQVRWRRVSLAVAAFLFIATVAGYTSGWIPTPAELTPRHDIGLPAPTVGEVDHANR